MARDRQRAKQRRARRRETVPPAAQRPGAGPLDHGSAGADEAAARLALGAEAAGLPTDAVQDDAGRAAELEREPAPTDDRSAATPARHREGSAPAPLRAASFLRNCWAELQRVQWPDRRQVAQATGVVLLFVIIAGAYLGLADAVAQRIVDTVI